MDARKAALGVLIACRKNESYADGALKDQIAKQTLDTRDAAFATRLVYCVLQNRALLDWYLAQKVHGKLSALQPVVLDILRLAACQILLLDRVPDRAAVNEAVEQAKKSANRQAAGLVNGVLRALCREKEMLEKPQALSVRFSHPQALVDLLRQEVGEEDLPLLLAADNAPAPVYFQVNTLKTDAASVLEILSHDGIESAIHPWLPDCVVAENFGNPEQSVLFREGKLYVQDAAAKLSVLASGVEPGMRVLDCCAAPGGKSFAAAIAMLDRGSIVSCDLHEGKIRLIHEGAERLGLSCIKAMQADASQNRSEWTESFDTVIADVPCSGLGVIRKKPDIRYKSLERLAELPAVQRSILENVSSYVKPGGVLLYSTCTILRRENEDVVAAFLTDHAEFQLEAFEVPEGSGLSNDGLLTLYPHRHGTDGFFMAKLRKQA